jgi:hypothetical protein
MGSLFAGILRANSDWDFLSQRKGALLVEIEVLEQPDGNVIARGSYRGGPDYEFVVAADGQVYFQIVGDIDRVWAGPGVEVFRRIVSAWQRYRRAAHALPSEAAQLECVRRLRAELMQLGALPGSMPADPEPLWSLLLFEAEHGLA